MQKLIRSITGLVVACALFGAGGGAFAQGVTTGSISGVVKDAQGLAVPGATVTALHEPSGSSYEAVAREDGRFTMPALRVGGPYTVTAALAGFQSAIRKDVFVTLGVGTDLSLKLETVAMAESVTVTAQAAGRGVQFDAHRRGDGRPARRAVGRCRRCRGASTT